MTIREEPGDELEGVSGWEGSRRLSRRRVALGLTALVAAGLVTAFGRETRGSTVAGNVAVDLGRGSPAASPAGASPAASPSGRVQVGIENFTFVPGSLTVAVGTEVTWTNHDDIPHTVTAVDRTTFASPGLDTDDHFSHRFTKPGIYHYFCSIHPVMTAQVIAR